MSQKNPALVHVLTVLDPSTEEVIEVIPLADFDLAAFVQQFAVPSEDAQMVDRYAVGPDDIALVRKAAGQQIAFSFAEYGYFIEAATL